LSAVLSFARLPVDPTAGSLEGPRPHHRGRRDGAAETWRGRPAPPRGPLLETERLILRLHRGEDFEALHALSASPAMWTYSERGPMAPEESWARLLRLAGQWSLRGCGMFAIEEKATGELVGEAGFTDFRRGLGAEFDPFPEASWTIRADRQRRGYATEAAAAAHAWLARTRGAARTVCLIHAENQASHGVAAKLGYKPFRSLEYRGYPALLLQQGGACRTESLEGEHGAAPERVPPR